MNSLRDLHKTLDNLLLNISFLLFSFNFNLISSTHLISSTSAGHVHSFHCLWFQKNFEKKEDIVPEHHKHHAYESWSLSGGKICPVHINFTSPQYKNCRIAIVLQFLVDFIELLVQCF